MVNLGKIGDIMTADVVAYIGLALILVDKAPPFLANAIPESVSSLGYLILLFGLAMAILNKITR